MANNEYLNELSTGTEVDSPVYDIDAKIDPTVLAAFEADGWTPPSED